MSPKSRKRKHKKKKPRAKPTPTLEISAALEFPKSELRFGSQKFPIILSQAIPGELGIKNPQIRNLMNQRYPAPLPTPCAENLNVLIDHLSKEDQGGYLYRGQTRQFPALIPSIFRRAMVPGTEGDAVIEIDSDRFHASLSERDRIRFKLLSEMMHAYGPSVGNIIAQQYGLSSEALDATSDLKIAAFFATRRYPKYEHYAGTEDNREGVIYRFPIHESVPDIGTLDTLYSLALKHIEPLGEVRFMAFKKRFDLSERLIRFIENSFQESGGVIQAELRTRPLVVNHLFYQREIQESWKNRLRSAIPSLSATRLLRQQGGSIRTISRWIASIPIKLDAVMDPDGGFIFDPPFAIGEKLIGVENVSRYPRLEIFPFKHSAEKLIDLSPDYLWPGPETDWMYDHLMTLFRMRHCEFLERSNRAVNDLREGLIDPGYE